MDYRFAALMLFAAYIIFRVTSWVVSHAIKLAFLVAFIALGVLSMSSTVGLL